MLRVMHTADWHLGHSLHGASREWEQRCFLDWLLDTLESTETDALVVAGDIFDSANPPAAAQRALYDFLAACQRRLPGLDVVLVAGNHDSPSRLEAPAPILAAFGVHAIGSLPRSTDGAVDAQRLLVPLTDRGGEVAAWCAAIPYLRPQDLPGTGDDDADPLVAGVRCLHEQVFTALEACSDAGQALLATGHCYMVGTRLSELSERKILGGNQHALPAELYPDLLGYVALGHLHLAQTVAGRETLRYSGSPLPLSLAEGTYRHQVLQVDLDADRPAVVTPLPVPRRVEILRVPEDGPRPLDEVIERLGELRLEARDEREHPYLELRVLLDGPQPELRQRVTEALEGLPVRLLRIATSTARTATAAPPEVELGELDPVEVFARRYRSSHDDEPRPELVEAFHELLETVQREER